MQILRGLKNYSDDFSPLILGMGNFDGLHLGHQALLQAVVEKARRVNGQAAVLTFQDHPQHILHPHLKTPLLMTPEYKFYLLKEFGIDLCFYLPFDEEFSKMDAVDFVENILHEQLKVREVCLGFNAYFGHERRGNANLMRQLASQYGFEFEEIEAVKTTGDFVSSSRVRSLIQNGQLDLAAACLGRPFSFLGEVVHGSGRGKKLGFPTANLKIENETMPPAGVYLVSVRQLVLNEKILEQGKTEFQIVSSGPWLQGVMNYGFRPTFRQFDTISEMKAEVFCLDFDGDLYGRTLEVVFHRQLRPEKSFETPELLQKQIEEDVNNARHYFAGLPKKNFTKITDFSILSATK